MSKSENSDRAMQTLRRRGQSLSKKSLDGHDCFIDDATTVKFCKSLTINRIPDDFGPLVQIMLLK